MKTKGILYSLMILNIVTIAWVLGVVITLSSHKLHPDKKYSHEQFAEKVEALPTIKGMKEMLIKDDSYIRSLEVLANDYNSGCYAFGILVSLFSIANLGLLFLLRKSFPQVIPPKR
jgi:hypothetical protein